MSEITIMGEIKATFAEVEHYVHDGSFMAHRLCNLILGPVDKKTVTVEMIKVDNDIGFRVWLQDRLITNCLSKQVGNLFIDGREVKKIGEKYDKKRDI